MKTISFWQFFKMGVAIAAGWEIGKELPNAVAYAINKNNRQHYRRIYRDTVAKETAKQNGMRVVPDPAEETPTK